MVLKRTESQLLTLAGEAVRETLWPSRCVICDVPGSPLCAPCRAALRFVDYWQACPRCGAPFGRLQCTECSATALAGFGLLEPSFDACRSVVHFDDASARIVRAWKDEGERRLISPMVEMMAALMPSAWRAYPLSVIGVPASERALRIRGFDHGKELARALGASIGLPVEEAFLPPKHVDQRKLVRTQRQRNAATAFQIRDGWHPPEAVLLVDDVCTTGATLLGAARELKNAGAALVFALTFLRTY